jgi:hypothetical protein
LAVDSGYSSARGGSGAVTSRSRSWLAELVGGLGAGLDGAGAGHAQHPDRLHDAAAGLGGGGGLAGQHRAGGGLGVGGVGLVTAAAALAVGPVNLDHLDAGAGQELGQPGAVGAGALHAGTGELAVVAGPGQQLLVAGAGGRDDQPAVEAAELVQQGGDVHVAVGVDADGDATVPRRAYAAKASEPPLGWLPPVLSGWRSGRQRPRSAGPLRGGRNARPMPSGPSGPTRGQGGAPAGRPAPI